MVLRLGVNALSGDKVAVADPQRLDLTPSLCLNLLAIYSALMLGSPYGTFTGRLGSMGLPRFINIHLRLSRRN